MSLPCQIFQPAHGLVRGREGQTVTRGFGNREQVKALTVFFCGVETIELRGLFASAQKVVIVDRNVADTGVHQRGHHGGFPDPLGEPRAGRAHAEVLFDLVGQCGDLRYPVAVRDGGQHRLAIAGTKPFNLAAFGHAFQQRHVFGKSLQQIVEQPAGEMHAETKRRVAFHDTQKHAVAAGVGIVDDSGEVANRLVGMHTKEERDGHGALSVEGKLGRLHECQQCISFNAEFAETQSLRRKTGKTEPCPLSAFFVPLRSLCRCIHAIILSPWCGACCRLWRCDGWFRLKSGC